MKCRLSISEIGQLTTTKMTELAKDKEKKSLLKSALKSIKSIIRMLGLIFFILIAPYVIAVITSFFKMVILGNLNLSDFVVDLETNGISAVSNFYWGIIDSARDLIFRLSH